MSGIALVHFLPLRDQPKSKPMKKYLILSFSVATLLLVVSCSETRTKAFDARFTGTYTAVTPDSVLCGPGGMHVIVDGTGSNDLMGEFTVHFDFCVDPEGYYGEHGMSAFMIDSQGDTLFLGMDERGRVIEGRLDEHPSHVVSYWQDEFLFTGGSGKFEGATGSCVSDDFNSSEDAHSHHHWTGEITLANK